jgi:hypothetical protein
VISTNVKVIAVLILCASVSGCLQNNVERITGPRLAHTDSTHAIVVVGIGLDAAWPAKAFSLSLDAYSLEKRDISGNCFRYNHIEATRPPNPAQVTYFAYLVPAGIYVYSPFNANSRLAASARASAFIAPPGKAVYFGDYVLVDNQTVELRSNIDAARSGVRSLIHANLPLQAAEPATTASVHGFLCTP